MVVATNQNTNLQDYTIMQLEVDCGPVQTTLDVPEAESKSQPLSNKARSIGKIFKIIKKDKLGSRPACPTSSSESASAINVPSSLESQKVFTCEHCGAIFAKSTQVGGHTRHHHPGKSVKY